MSDRINLAPLPTNYLTPKRRIFPELNDVPRCSSELLFIWEAIEMVGQALDADWDGTELKAHHWPLSPHDGDKQAGDSPRRASATLSRGPNIPRPYSTYVDSNGVRRLVGDTVTSSAPEVSEESWAEAIRIRSRVYEEALQSEQQAWERNQAAVKRLRAACDWLDVRLRDDVLKGWTRLVCVASPPEMMTADQWFCDTFKERFVPGQYKRWCQSPLMQRDAYIFIDRATLEAALHVQAEPVVAGLDMNTLSPFLRLAIRVAHDLNISETNHGVKKEVVQDEIERLMVEYGLSDGDLGRTAKEYLATFVRWPKAKQGRALKE